MEEIERIQQAVKDRQYKRFDRTVGIGQIAEQFMAGHVKPRQTKYGDIVDVWEQVLPDELTSHCEIVNISGGQLTVKVDSPSYKYELHLCSSEILKELQKECPRARLTKIKFVNA